MTVDIGGKAYEVRHSADPRLRCSLCSLRGCRGNAPCMDLPVGSYLWAEPEKREARTEPFVTPHAEKTFLHGVPLAADVKGRIVEAGKRGDRADVTAERENVARATVYRVWRRAKAPDGEPPHTLRVLRVGKKALQKKKATGGKRGPKGDKLHLMREILEKEPTMGNGELARRLGISADYVGRLRRAEGLPGPPKKGTRPSLADKPEVVEYVKAHNAEGNKAIAKALGLGVSTIAHLRKALGLLMTKAEVVAKAQKAATQVTEEQLAYIREHAGKETDAAIAGALGMRARHVCYHRNAMGLPATRKYTQRMLATKNDEGNDKDCGGD